MPSQVAVVGLLDARLPHHVLRLVAGASAVLQLRLADRADVAEHLGAPATGTGTCAGSCPASGRRGTGLVLLEVVDLVLVDPAPDDDRRQRVGAGRFRCATISLTGIAGDLGERLQLLELACQRLRQVGRPELEAGARARSQRAPCPLRSTIVPRGASTGASGRGCRSPRPGTAAGEHLQRPEAQEEDGEHGERDEAEDRDAERELRREPVGLLDPGVAREEAARPLAALAKETHLAHAVERRRAAGRAGG